MDAQIGTGPYTADIGDGIESFDTLADLQRAMRAQVSGIRSSSEWYRQMRSRHGAKVHDAAGKVVATVSYNGRLWRPSGAREEIGVEWGMGASAGAGGALDPKPTARAYTHIEAEC
jgi:hypothetical protein